MRRCLLGLVVVTGLLAGGAPAAAGGWWSTVSVNLHPVGAGETVTARSEAWFSTTEQAEAATSTTKYFAYLVRGYDRALLQRAMGVAEPGRWWALKPDAEVVRVGRVRFGTFDANVGEARARIAIPADLRGQWSLMFCNAGCRTPMAHAVPTTVMVAADAVAAQTARRLIGFERREREVVARLHEQVDAARAEAHRAGTDAQAARETLAGMRLDLDMMRAAQEQSGALPPWVWGGGGLLLGLALGALARRGPAVADGAEDPGGPGWEHPRRLVGSGRRR